MFIIKGKRIHVLTTRFNPKTYIENMEYKKTIGFHGTLYGSPKTISQKIPNNSICFVIEMLNLPKTHKDYPGKIVGIGLLKNKLKDRRCMIYSDQNYNRYTYFGGFHIGREQLLHEHSEFIHSIEHSVFRGKGHLKRAQGITCVPESFLRKHETIAVDIYNLFCKHVQTFQD